MSDATILKRYEQIGNERNYEPTKALRILVDEIQAQLQPRTEQLIRRADAIRDFLTDHAHSHAELLDEAKRFREKLERTPPGSKQREELFVQAKAISQALSVSIGHEERFISEADKIWTPIKRVQYLVLKVNARLGVLELGISFARLMFLVFALLLAVGIDHVLPIADGVAKRFGYVHYHTISIVGLFALENLTFDPLGERARNSLRWMLYSSLLLSFREALCDLSGAEAEITAAEEFRSKHEKRN